MTAPWPPGGAQYGWQPGPGPDVRWIGGRPALPERPGALQIVGFWMLVLGIVGLPVTLIAVRLVVAIGWMTFIFLLYGGFLVVGVQIVLAVAALVMMRGWSPPAIGRWAAVSSFVYYLSWILLLLSVGDVGDSADSAVASWLERALGVSETFAGGVAAVSVVVGVVALVATLVLIIVEGIRARSRALRAAAERGLR